ncbi:MAG: MotA/TolQ/ExbB proton channel family protein [Pirellulaceae bacterium]
MNLVDHYHLVLRRLLPTAEIAGLASGAVNLGQYSLQPLDNPLIILNSEYTDMRIIGLAMALIVILLAMAGSGSLLVFVNVPGLLFVLILGVGIVLASHGMSAIHALAQLVSGRRDGNRQQIKSVLDTAILSFTAAGWIGVIVGGIQMLCVVEDVSAMGPGLALAMLAALYGYTIAYLVCLPLARGLESRGQATSD